MVKRDKLMDALPARVVEYIDLVVRKMRYRRRVRQDVQRELAAHFYDALGDCTDDTERNALADKLIKQFGPPKVLAKLIRRGKKRCRSWWRKAIIRSFQGIGVLILLLILYTAWFMTGTANVRVNYVQKLNEMARPGAREDQNAWPYYEKAIAQYVEPGEDVVSVIDRESEMVLRYGDLCQNEQADMQEWLEENQASWDNLYPSLQAELNKYMVNGLAPILNNGSRYAKSQYLQCRIELIIERVLESIARNIALWDLPIKSSGWGIPTMALRNGDELVALMKEHNPGIEQFTSAVAVAVLRDWISRTREPEKAFLAGLDADDYHLIVQWIKDNEPAWQQFVIGSRMPYCYRQYEESDDAWMIAIPLRHLGPMRVLASLGVWRARLAAQEGRITEAMANCVAIVRVGKHWQVGKIIVIEQMAGRVISYLGSHEMRSLLARHQVSADHLKRLQQDLSDIHSQGYPLIDITGERLFLLDVVQHVFSEGGLGGGHLLPREEMLHDMLEWEPSKEVTYLAATMIHARRDETLKLIDRLWSVAEKDVKMSPYQLHASGRETHGELFEDMFTGKRMRYRYMVVVHMMPILNRAGMLAFRDKAEYEATLTVLALKRWRLTKGAYPEELSELVTGGYLQTLPDDPYADGALKYDRRRDDFVLYSLGGDFDDDRGYQHPDESWGEDDAGGDHVFWPVKP